MRHLPLVLLLPALSSIASAQTIPLPIEISPVAGYFVGGTIFDYGHPDLATNLKFANDVSYGLGQTILGNRIEVGDIQYNSGGVARFRANSISDAPDSEIWGNAGLFDYQETWDYVRIFNYSPKTLVTHLIDVVNGGQRALITIAVDDIPGPTDSPGNNGPTPPDGSVSLPENADSGVTIEWTIIHSFIRSVVEIHNFQPGAVAASNIVLAGQLDTSASRDMIDSTIEKPIGTTIVTNERGSVVVSSAFESSHAEPVFQLLRTTILTLNLAF